MLLGMSSAAFYARLDTECAAQQVRQYAVEKLNDPIQDREKMRCIFLMVCVLPGRRLVRLSMCCMGRLGSKAGLGRKKSGILRMFFRKCRK